MPPAMSASEPSSGVSAELKLPTDPVLEVPRTANSVRWLTEAVSWWLTVSSEAGCCVHWLVDVLR
jgi:hypothetical protein